MIFGHYSIPIDKVRITFRLLSMGVFLGFILPCLTGKACGSFKFPYLFMRPFCIALSRRSKAAGHPQCSIKTKTYLFSVIYTHIKNHQNTLKTMYCDQIPDFLSHHFRSVSASPLNIHVMSQLYDLYMVIILLLHGSSWLNSTFLIAEVPHDLLPFSTQSSVPQ